MIRTPIKSTNLAAIAYDAETGVLEVAFRPNRRDEASVRHYFDVPIQVFEKLRDAEANGISAGSYFHHGVRERFRNREVAVIISGVERPVERPLEPEISENFA